MGGGSYLTRFWVLEVRSVRRGQLLRALAYAPASDTFSL